MLRHVGAPIRAALPLAVALGVLAVPACGVGGASTSSVSTYQPTNFCVHQGDFVDFNDEGGFDPGFYPAGVAYEVIGRSAGGAMSSFVRANATNNGDALASTDSTNHDGFAANSSVEVLLQAALGTGPDATPLCPGGTKGTPGRGG